MRLTCSLFTYHIYLPVKANHCMTRLAAYELGEIHFDY